MEFAVSERVGYLRYIGIFWEKSGLDTDWNINFEIEKKGLNPCNLLPIAHPAFIGKYGLKYGLYGVTGRSFNWSVYFKKSNYLMFHLVILDDPEAAPAKGTGFGLIL